MYRRYPNRSIWQEMNRLQREMNRFFGDMIPGQIRTAPGFPAMNIWADDNSALITAEMPGVDKKNLEINVTGDTLTISGERSSDILPEDAVFHRRERSQGKFDRSIQLPYTVDVEKVKATLKNGILEVFLPRIEKEKPKKITVKAA